MIREAARVPDLEYAFRHELTRDAAYHSILRRRCRQFHRRVGEAIEELFADRLDEQVNRLAHHFDEAGDKERALKYQKSAGKAASRLYANTEAATFYSRAIEIARELDVPGDELIYLYTRNGRALQLSNRYEEVIANFEELEGLAREKGDRTLELASLLPRATVHSTYTAKFDPQRGQELSKRALSLARELSDVRTEAKALWNLMLLEIFDGHDHVKAVEYGEQAMAIAREHGLKEELAYTLNDISRAYLALANYDRARDVLEEAGALWRELGNMPMLSDYLGAKAQRGFEQGNLDEALAAARERRRD